MTDVTEVVAATADPGTDTAQQVGTPGSEAATPSPSDAGTGAATPQTGTPQDAAANGSLQNPIRRSDPPDSVVQRPTPPAPPVAKPEVPAPPQVQVKPQQPQLPEETWQKRYQDSLPYTQKLASQVEQMQRQLQQWQGLDPQQVRQHMAMQQQQAQIAQLKPWNRDHPGNAPFNALKERLKAQYDLANELPPELRQDAIARINAKVSPEDRKNLDEYRAWREREQEMSPEERDDRQREVIRQEFAQLMSQRDQFEQTRGTTQQFLQQNAEVLEKHREAVLWGMNHPARREVGVRLAQLEEENEKLRQQVAKETQEVETARARDAYTKQRATVRRDATAAVVSDPASEAAKLGLRGEQLFDYLAKQRTTA